MEKLSKILSTSGFVPAENPCPGQGSENSGQTLSPFHAEARGHSLNQCREFREKAQGLLDSKVLTVSPLSSSRQEKEIDIVEGSSSAEGLLKPCTIKYREKAVVPSSDWKPATIKVPSPFAYKSSKAVPWKYECTVTIGQEVQPPSLPVENITDAGGMTRTGRCYTPENLMKRLSINERPVEKVDETKEKDKRGKAKLVECDPKQPVSEEEAQEFLKLIKQSEYKIIEQLGQTPAKLSILSLLLSSEAHRNAVLNVLKQAFVSQDISVDNLSNVVGNVTASSSITFTEEKIPPEGTGHTKALHCRHRI